MTTALKSPLQKKKQDKGLQKSLADLEELERCQGLISPQVFGQRYLGHYFKHPTPFFHKQIYKMLVDGKPEKREAIAAPRGHGKSVLLGLVYPLWVVCTGRKRFIVIMSSSHSIAVGFLMGIRHELETNELLNRDFGQLANPDNKWTEAELFTANGVRLVAKGAGASMRGLRRLESRPDVIIVDDIEDDEEVTSYEQRQKLDKWFNRTVLNLPGPDGADVFVIGTVLHYDSLLSKLLKQWNGSTYKAIAAADDPLGRGVEEPLWPEAYPLSRLHKIRDGDGEKEGIGSIAFEQEYQNNPIDPESQRIRPEWIRDHAYKDEEIEDAEMVVVSSLDPALGKSGSKGDYAALVTCGLLDGKIYVLDCEMRRCTPQAQVDMCTGKAEYFLDLLAGEKDPTPHYTLQIEDNGFQEVLKDIIREKSGGVLGVQVSVKGVRNLTKKEIRIDSLSAPIEQGTVRFREKGQEQLIAQLVQFPKGDHDDGPDALEMCVRALRRLGRARVRVV